MHVHYNTELVTSKYGLAFHTCTTASPHHTNGYRIAVTTRECPCAAPSRFPKHPQSGNDIPSGRRWCRWYPAHIVGMERMETSRSYSYQQSVEKQNGQRDQETVGQCRSLHNASPINWSSNCSNWLLVIGQLLVPRPGRSCRHRGLTNTQTPSKSRHSDKRGECLIIDIVVIIETIKSRERLAFSRTV